MTSVERIAVKALSLPKDQRLTLAHRILASVEPAETREIDAAWDREIRQRIEKDQAHPELRMRGRKVFAELDKKLRG